MSIDLYQASVPQFLRMLGNLKGILEKAAAHAAAKKIDESALLNARLFPDMFPLTVQVQIASDFARGTSARLSGIEPPAIEDKEKSFAELIARVDAAIAYVRGIPAAKFEGAEDRKIKRKIRGVGADVLGHRLPVPVRAAELLLPPDDDVRDPAPQRRRGRQGRFPGLVRLTASEPSSSAAARSRRRGRT